MQPNLQLVTELGFLYRGGGLEKDKICNYLECLHSICASFRGHLMLLVALYPGISAQQQREVQGLNPDLSIGTSLKLYRWGTPGLQQEERVSCISLVWSVSG